MLQFHFYKVADLNVFSCLHRCFPLKFLRTSILKNICERLLLILTFISGETHFMPLISFYTPWKHQKTIAFLMFSEGIKKTSRKEWVTDAEIDFFIKIQVYAKQSFRYTYFWNTFLILLKLFKRKNQAATNDLVPIELNYKNCCQSTLLTVFLATSTKLKKEADKKCTWITIAGKPFLNYAWSNNVRGKINQNCVIFLTYANIFPWINFLLCQVLIKCLRLLVSIIFFKKSL